MDTKKFSSKATVLGRNKLVFVVHLVVLATVGLPCSTPSKWLVTQNRTEATSGSFTSE